MHAQTATEDRKPRPKPLRPGKPLKKGGPVATRVRDLLAESDLTYDQIAERVRSEIPEASTSARSVASVASALRREGFRVPDRRRKA